MGVHRGITASLETMLTKEKRMIADGNPFNDGAAMGLLHAFDALVGA